MLRILRGGQRWLTALFVIGIGGVFVFFLGLGGPLTGPTEGALVEVGPHVFGVREFERARAQRERMLQAQLGDQFDSRALRDTVDSLTARQLVDQALLAIEGQNLGLAVSTREIERQVLADPGFRDEAGKFDKEAFERFTAYEYGSQHAYLEERRLGLLAFKMLQLLNAQPQVSEGEARAAVMSQMDQVRIGFVALDATIRSEDVAIETAAIEAALADRATEIQALYDELGSRYNAPEQVRARHILRKVDKDASEEAREAVRASAEAALQRVQGGEEFEAVATEVSEDPGSAARGGDLGFFGRGQMVKEFEETAFGMEPGKLSGVVRTDYGFHVIRVEERKEAVSRPLEEVRAEVAEELLRREARNEKAREQADALSIAIDGGQSLEDAARSGELTLERSGWLTRRADGFVPGLGAAQDLLATAFSMQPGESSSRIFEVGDKFALVQLIESQAADPAEVEKRVTEVRQTLLTEKRNARAGTWVDRRRQQLLAAGELTIDLESLR